MGFDQNHTKNHMLNAAQKLAELLFKFQVIFEPIDDYAKDSGPEDVRLLCSFYHEPLRT